MSATISLKSLRARRGDATLSFIQYVLIIVGLMLALDAIKPIFAASGNGGTKPAGQVTAAAMVTTGQPSELPEALPAASAASPAEAAEEAPEELRPSLKRALDYVSRRYRVAPEALVPIFEAAESVGRERRLDPLLIIAIIGIESRFNPFAESPVGAKGLMQVMPGIHLDKVPEGAGEQPFLDPVTNIQVGVHVLEEAIRWRGSLTRGLQHYGGSPKDPATGYANRVLAEKQRLEQAARGSGGSHA